MIIQRIVLLVLAILAVSGILIGAILKLNNNQYGSFLFTFGLMMFPLFIILLLIFKGKTLFK